MNYIHKLFVLMLLAVTAVVVTGCITENEHGCCEPPKENLEWFYIEQQALLLGSNYWCVVCDTSIADEDVVEWIKANAGEDFLSYAHDEGLEDFLPCLYVYADAESAAECQSAICRSDFKVNDPVGKGHGAGRRIAPLLGR